MNKLKRLSAVAILTSLLSIASFAQAEVCAPGQTSTPPCALQQTVSDPSTLGETSTPPASESVAFLSLAETALALVF